MKSNKSDNSESKQASHPVAPVAGLKTEIASHLDRARSIFQTAFRLIDENPHIVRSIAVLPLLITWFIGLHKEEHRNAAYRGFLLSALFLLSSWVLYWIIHLLRAYLEDGFALQLIAFTLQSAFSLIYVALSVRLAIAEYRRKELPGHLLDRLKDRLLETI